MSSLTRLGALGTDKLEEKTESEDRTRITELGRVLAAIPILPKFGKLLLEARQQKVIVY